MGDARMTPSTTALLLELLFEDRAARCLVAPDGTVLRANREWLRSTGRSLDEVVGADAVGLLPHERDVAAELHARARAGARVEVPPLPRRVQGRETWWEGSIDPVPMTGGTGLLVTLREVASPGRDPADDARLERSEAMADEARLAACRLHALIATIPAGVIVADAQGRFTLVNEAAQAVFGPATGDASGPEGGYDLLRSEGGGPFPREDLPIVRALERGEVTRDVEILVRRSDGSDQTVLAAAAPVRDEQGAVVGAVVALQDITDRKRAEDALRESEHRFRALAGAMPQIVCALGPDGTPEYVNSTWIAYSGMDFEATARAGWLGVLHPDDVPAARKCLRRARERKAPQDVELRYRAADGSFRWFLSRLAPILDGTGHVVRYVGAGMDIDDRRRAEAERESLLARVQDADRRKDEFLGMLSHELRNPLAPIRHSVYILEHAEAAGERGAHARAVIQRQAEHLTRLVDDLLDVTRVARGKVQLRRERVDLREVVRRAAEDFRPLMRERGLAFQLSLPEEEVWTDADATRITQLVGNLLHNAAKFTRRGDVALSLRALEGVAEIRVRDTGEGIDAALLPRVFDSFVQGHRTLARTEGGLGLGLALVKGLAELHGGTVRVESAGRGAGAEFQVQLPILASPEAGGPERPAAPRPGPARRVLVVDDNRDAAESLAEIVQMFGHEVEVAYDGLAAVEKARATAPDVVLCDIGLPGMSGYDVARALRTGATRRIQLVAVSGYAQPEDLKAAFEAGFERHIAKPASPEEVERLLRQPVSGGASPAAG